MSDTRCGVTGLPRGRKLGRAIENVVDPEGDEGWVLYIRVDRIEQVNARYSREDGNAVLSTIADILRRTADAPLYRGEGPIFVMVLSGDTEHALKVAERLRRAVAEADELLEPMTVSIALVAGTEGRSVEDIESNAFARLLIARRRGGDSVCAVSRNDGSIERSSGTVLLVDPEVESLVALVREMEAQGMSVVTATDGLEGLQVVSQSVPDVVISELTVPHIGGFELRTRMRRSEQLAIVPFILLSHRRNDDLIREASSLRILHYHQKPASVVLIAELAKNLALVHSREG